MKALYKTLFVRALAVGCCLQARHCHAAPFVEITAEIAVDNWAYGFPPDGEQGSLFAKPVTQTCVVGANSWTMQNTSGDDTITWWCIGTNLTQYVVNTNDTRGGTSFPAVTERYKRVFETVDGNPHELMGKMVDVPEYVSWLAFCSGPFLKHEGRKIYPPGGLSWWESAVCDYDWRDQTVVFPDAPGLPQSISLISSNNQCIFRYKVLETTNAFGWTFPREFFGLQYIGGVSNGWRIDLSFKGRVTSIRPAAKPEIPMEAMKTRRVQ